jgi:hypothetical protein
MAAGGTSVHVITAKSILERLGEQPFRPFRICLSDGSAHEVPHREFAWVFGNRIFVGVAANGAAGENPQVRELSELHVTRIEDRAQRRRRRVAG